MIKKIVMVMVTGIVALVIAFIVAICTYRLALPIEIESKEPVIAGPNEPNIPLMDCGVVEYVEPEPNDTDRRAFYLMPKKDSADWKAWTDKYGNSADSWEMFTMGFHTRYLNELNKRITVLEKTHEPNQPAKAD